MNIKICRLCLQENTSDSTTILVDIFESEGKSNFCEKINWISGLNVRVYIISLKSSFAKIYYF